MLGCSQKSFFPAPQPMLSMVMAGCSTNSFTTVARIAAPGGHAAAREDRLHIGQKPIFLLIGGDDRDGRGRDAVALDLLDLQRDRQAEGVKHVANRRRVDASVDQRGQSHVAADATKTV